MADYPSDAPLDKLGILPDGVRRQPLEDAEFTMHLSEFTRREEIWTYAVAQGISFNEAVVRLVNHALSHRAHQAEQRSR